MANSFAEHSDEKSVPCSQFLMLLISSRVMDPVPGDHVLSELFRRRKGTKYGRISCSHSFSTNALFRWRKKRGACIPTLAHPKPVLARLHSTCSVADRRAAKSRQITCGIHQG
jgi:hypothetical protein